MGGYYLFHPIFDGYLIEKTVPGIKVFDYFGNQIQVIGRPLSNRLNKLCIHIRRKRTSDFYSYLQSTEKFGNRNTNYRIRFEYYIAAYSYSYPYGFRLGLWSAIPEEIKNSDIMEKKEAKRKYFS